jgi:acetyl-CoA carboxylase biotin carboxyl carrier protein
MVIIGCARVYLSGQASRLVPEGPTTRATRPPSAIISTVADLQKRIDDLADLMDEFGLEKAEIRGEDWSVGFDRNGPSEPIVNGAANHPAPAPTKPKKKKAAVPKGTPVSSPMTGIFYSAPSPGAPPFCKTGETVSAGQVVGLIEAMKVFNEITAPLAGTVTAIKAESGQLVQPGDPLIYIG